MRRQFEGGDNKASICEASGDYLSAATIRGRRLIEEIRYVPSRQKLSHGAAVYSAAQQKSRF